MSLRSGEIFAGYRILRLLGAGGMGEVYLVQHPRLPRREALKVLRGDLSNNPSFRERFIREADLAAGLHHPHVVAIHDRGEYDRHLWIAMDYIEGTDAARLLEQRYPAGMAADVAIPIIVDVANALDYAHRNGVLHRDVKPANVIVDDLDGDERRVFLTDFGIARPIDDTNGITATNMTLGTVAYAAPEQLMGEQLDGRADQYALAVTGYQLLTGALPFEHSNPAVMISRHLNAAPPKLSHLRPELVHLDAVLARALSKDPRDRFPRCVDFAHALADGQLVEGSAPTSQKSTAVTSVAPNRPVRAPTELLPTAQRSRPSASKETSSAQGPLIASALAAMVLLVFVVFALVVQPGRLGGALSGPISTPASGIPSITFESMRDVVTAYYANLPAQPDQAWTMVASDGNGESAKEKYLDFWSRIESVDLISVTPRDATSVVAQLAYVRKDGGVDAENRWLTIAVVDDGLKIHSSERIGRVSGPSPSPRSPSPSPTVSSDAIDRLLLSSDQLTHLLGAKFTDDPSASGGGLPGLALDSSSYGTSDHSHQVTPSLCVGVVFTGDRDSYAAIRPDEIKTQTFGTLYARAAGEPHLLQQTAAIFSTEQKAQQWVAAMEEKWRSCALGDVDAQLGFENGASYVLGPVQRDGTLVTVSMAKNDGLNGPDACQQAIGARLNVVAETRSCEVPDLSPTQYDSAVGWRRDPTWAVPDAAQVAEAILNQAQR